MKNTIATRIEIEIYIVVKNILHILFESFIFLKQMIKHFLGNEW